jgi:UDP-GlcNAc:undecaprenyl-phosphate GlcNAc-1-phosphate transferase
MMRETLLWFTAVLLCTAAASSALTVAIRALAPRLGLTDQPDGHRKLHGTAIPLGGGLAIFLASLLALAVIYFLAPEPWRSSLHNRERWLWGTLAASAAIVVLGLLDDRFCLRGRHKLTGQVVISLCLALAGLTIHRISLFGYECDLGLLAVPFTVLWLLGAINAINLLDGIDGLATVLGLVLSLTFAAIAVFIGRPEIAILAVVFAGSLAGFGLLNLPPASIFLGDAGSMLIGFFLGVLAIKGSMKGPGTVLLATPLAVWTLPILDSAAAIVRRKLTGRSIYAADRGHLHHRLMDRLGSNTRVLLLVAVCCGVTSAAAMVSVVLKSDVVALSVGLAVAAVFVASGAFGRVEFLLLLGRLRSFWKSFLRLGVRGQPAASQSSVRLQGSAPWEHVWEALTESAEKLLLRRLHLDVNMPQLQEGFNAVWEQQGFADDDHCWRLDMPLMVDNQQVGRLKVIGQSRQDAETSTHEDLAMLLELVGTCESYLESLILTHRARRAKGNRPSGEIPLALRVRAGKLHSSSRRG